jgi:hypothetical protein
MKSAHWFRLLIVAAVLASACGSANTPATGSASSPSPTSLATTTPTPKSTVSLALVTLRGSDAYLVRDITDIGHPKTVSNLGKIPAPQFVSGTELSYALDSSLYRVPLTGSPKTLVTSKGGAGVWSPDGSAVIYSTTVSPETTTVHQFKGGRDQVLGSVPGGGGGGCESVAGCAIANSLDFRLLYSPDGTQISLVTTGFSGSSFRVWSSAGKLLKSSDAQGPTMSAWSGSSLFYRDNTGVQVWRDGVISQFLPGVTWIKAQGSPAGGQVVYTARDSTGWGHIYVVDTATKEVREIKSHRSDAVFLTSRYIWYQGERACVAADACGATPPWHPASGKTYIYDLQDGSETESIITGVSDVWPHAA